MEFSQIRAITRCIPYAVAILFFLFILTIAHDHHPGRVAARVYDRISSRLKERKTSRLFNYEKTQKFLRENGAAQHCGAWMEPIKFMATKYVSAAIFFSLGLQAHWGVAAIGTAIGYLVPDILLIYINKQDNYKMLPQIQTMYNTLTVQIKAGVYVTDAISECYRGMPDGRIRVALEELSSELFMKNSFEEAIGNFNGKFSNGFIDSLCIILLQAQESGQAVQLLRDITDQVKDMQAALLIRRKEKLDRTSTLCVLGIVAAAMLIIIYACVMAMGDAASSL